MKVSWLALVAMALPLCQVLSKEPVLLASSTAAESPMINSEDTRPLDAPRRRLDGIIWKYAPRSKHLHAPSYKNKTVAPHVDAWEKMVFFNPAVSRHKKRRSAAYVALTAKDFDPTVRALLRFAKESTMEVTTASKLRAGAQRDGSRPAPFHAALMVGSHVAAGCVTERGLGGRAAVIKTSKSDSCDKDSLAYFTVLRNPLEFAQDYFYRLSRRYAVELASMDWREEKPGKFSQPHLEAIEAFVSQKPKLLKSYNHMLRQRPQHTHFTGTADAFHRTIDGQSRGNQVTSAKLYSSNAVQAAHVIRLYRFLVGFEDRLDEFLVLLRARLGWGFRSLLSFQDSRALSNRAVDVANAAANANAANAHAGGSGGGGGGGGSGDSRGLLDGMPTSNTALFKPGLKGWPLQLVMALNKSAPVQEDWAFLALAKQQWAEQATAFGAARLEYEASQFRSVASALQRLCDPSSAPGRGRSSSSSHQGPSPQVADIQDTIQAVQAGHKPCIEPDAGTAAADVVRGALQGEPSDKGSSSSRGISRGSSGGCAKTPEEVFKCMLRLYDSCKAGIGPHTLCDYFDE